MDPVVALLTDFGTAGPYVAAMKGAMLSVCPSLRFVDISHDVPAQDIVTGAHHLLAAVPYFPAGTIVLAVVDPGVGTTRRGLVASAGGYRCVGPDNGLLAPLLDALGAEALVSLEEPRFARPTVSGTFEGRDRFGPAAAWLATGVSLSAMGPAVSSYEPLRHPVPHGSGDRLRGEVVWVDRFGNLITNISRSVWDREARGRAGAVYVNGRTTGPLVRTYADVAPGTRCTVFGSTEQLEIAVREGSAAAETAAAAGALVEVVWG